MQSILVSMFRKCLLWLSAGTYEATSLTAANLVNHLEWFWLTSVQFGNVLKAFLLSLRGKIIANLFRFLCRRESKLVQKNCKKLPKLFHYGFTVKFFRRKRPECPFKYVANSDFVKYISDIALLQISQILLFNKSSTVYFLRHFSNLCG